MNLTTLKSLQSRIREATGADREIDYLIEDALSGNEPYTTTSGEKAFFDLPHYTTDPDGLGACVGLMREVLPGWRRSVMEEPDEFYITLRNPRPDNHYKGNDYDVRDEHALETHATLLAICAALIAEEEAKLTEKAG